jgi:hypothetical protein
MSAITATTTTRTATARAAKLRRAAVASAAVLAIGVFAGCGGRDDSADHASRGMKPAASVKQDTPYYSAHPKPDTSAPDLGSSRSDWEPSDSGSTEYDTGSSDSPGGSGNQYPAEARRTFMESCNASSGGMKTFCGCALDHLEQTMTFEEATREGLKIADGGRPSQRFYNAIKSCLTGSGSSPMEPA